MSITLKVLHVLVKTFNWDEFESIIILFLVSKPTYYVVFTDIPTSHLTHTRREKRGCIDVTCEIFFKKNLLFDNVFFLFIFFWGTRKIIK